MMKTGYAAGLAFMLLGGCATTVPELQGLGEKPAVEAVREQNLVNHVKCELHKAVQSVLDAEAADNLRNTQAGHPELTYSVDWIKSWGATVSLKVIVDEKASLAPGLTFTQTLHNVVEVFGNGGNVTVGQSSSQGLGASVASDATRTETIGFYYPFNELLAEGSLAASCDKPGGMFLDGDLRIGEFISSKMLLAEVPNTLTAKPRTLPFNVFTYEASFVVTKTASVTPAWKLVNVSINPTAPFLSGSHARTDDLVLTLGQNVPDKTGAPAPSDAARDAHLAALIGQSVASAIQSQQP